jgi:AraC-like DNA-binding protein
VDFESLATNLHLSYSHFRRLFRRHIGKSPHDYLLLCKMQRAARDLQRSGRQVKDVAYEAGYDDPAQFSKLFKKKIGLSPQQFRDAMP